MCGPSVVRGHLTSPISSTSVITSSILHTTPQPRRTLFFASSPIACTVSPFKVDAFSSVLAWRIRSFSYSGRIRLSHHLPHCEASQRKSLCTDNIQHHRRIALAVFANSYLSSIHPSAIAGSICRNAPFRDRFAIALLANRPRTPHRRMRAN